MSDRTPTPEQQAAIDAAGEVLVSASAGSGKTFVMVEKMISLILEQKAEVSSVLAVTFTKLAAGEMKERLRAALTARIRVETDQAARARLKEQLSDIPSADICTLHAFCTNVIRRYFYEGGLDGNFRVLDETEAAKLRARAAEAALEKLASSPSPAFSAACAAFAGSRGFGGLQKEVLRLYEKVVSRADHREFLEGMAARCGEEGFADAAAQMLEVWKGDAARLLARCGALAAAWGLAAEGAPAAHGAPAEGSAVKGSALAGDGGLTEKERAQSAAFVFGCRAMAEAALSAAELFAAAEGVRACKLPRRRSVGKKGEQSAAQAAADGQLAALREAAAALAGRAKALGARAEERAAFLSAGQVAAGLAEAVLAFDGEYAALKRRAGGLDFSDLEHKCLDLLRIPRVGAEVRARYTHVFVDEYQDVNPAQESILSLVAGENVFMVGDAKQSIYGFRGCSPAFFTQKYDRLCGQGRALTLNGNFRSASAVLDFVNILFSRVMTRESFALDYAATSCMEAGTQAQKGGRVHISLVPEEEEGERAERGVYSVKENLGPAEDEEYAEGALIADIILQEAGRTRLDPATGKQVPTRFGDIVILSRSLTARAARIVAELVRRGIPVAAAAEVNICDYPEVKTLVALLQFLDNGAQDIPLAAALKSALGGLTDGDLAAIRLAGRRTDGKDEPFYLACERCAEGQDALAQKLKTFFARAGSLRLRMQVRGAADVLAAILAETGMEAQLLALPCGTERMRRVRRLIEACGTLSVPAFLDRLKNDGRIGCSESGGEDAVRLMTMHASKGLEFPVVIVAGMSAPFNNKESAGVYYDDEWGFVPQAYNFEARTRSDTLLRRLVHGRQRRRRAADELRLFYVALTRAKSVLHLVFEKQRPFDADRAAEAGCMADFVDFAAFEGFDKAQAAACGQDARGAQDALYAPVFGGAVLPPVSRVLTAGPVDEAAAQAVRAVYRAPYPHAAALGLPVKTSPSQLLRERAGEVAPAEETDAAARQAEECYASHADAATGTAYHAFLELADFSAPPEAEIARVCALLPKEQAALLGRERLKDILKMPIFAEIGGFSLRREQPFLVGLPASKLYEGASEDTVLVQGVIDLLAVRGDEAVVVDYKYSHLSAEALRAHYAPQMEVYVAAAAQWPGVRTVRACLVNILCGYCVQVR